MPGVLQAVVVWEGGIALRQSAELAWNMVCFFMCLCLQPNTNHVAVISFSLRAGVTLQNRVFSILLLTMTLTCESFTTIGFFVSPLTI